MTGSKSSSLGVGQNGSNTKENVAPVNPLINKGYALPFFHYLQIPKSTTAANPETYTLNLPAGLIERLWIEFPRGCSGLAGVQIWRDVRQLFPLPEGVWLRSDNSVLNFRFSHEINNEPFEVVIKGYNEDDTYAHTIWIGIEMTGQRKDLPPQLQSFLRELTG